jgi:6-phosphogluconolactonase
MQVVLDPSGRFVYVPCLGSDWVRAYTLEDSTGRLAALNRPGSGGGGNIVVLPPGSGPRHLVLHPTLPVAYVINELQNTVARLDWDRGSGVLTANVAAQPQRVVSTLPPGAPPGCLIRQAATGCAVQVCAHRLARA